jgi:hypothetical protein
MRTIYFLHILAGSIGLLAGYVALYATKGAPLHRRAGMAFVCTMLAMCVFGATIALVRDVALSINIPAAVLTAYLVITALTTVRPSVALGGRAPATVLMLVALTLGLTDLTFGFQAVANGGTRNGMPAFPFFMFGTVGMLGALGDIRVLRTGAHTGAKRLARHLWRMSFALFVAALSAAVQFVKLIPREYRFPGLIAIPMLLVLVPMFYWLWRVRVRRSLRGVVVGRATAVA